MQRIKSFFAKLRTFFFPPADASRWVRLAPYGVMVLLFFVLVGAGAYGWEYTNSPEFCGTSCHTMPPEYTSYQLSPHARIKCVECHIGREFVGNQITRKIGDFRHVVAQVFNTYEYPLHAHNMRPAPETCERCHNPEKFSDDSQRVVIHYAPDEQNTLYRTYLTMKTGGGSVRQGLGRGIHWHIENEVYYYAEDANEQVIPYVKAVNLVNGSEVEYTDYNSDFDPFSVGEEDLKQMDCITCHNRITHNIPKPEEAVEQAMFRKLISTDIPEIRRKGVEVLRGDYASNEEALKAIGGLTRYYEENHPDFADEHPEEIMQAVNTLKEIYSQSVFPDQMIDWDTHSNNLGHKNDPGCFRCHDGKHLNAAGQAIRLECNLCHAIPMITGPEDETTTLVINHEPMPGTHQNPNWISLHMISYDENDEDEICSDCHEIGDYEAADNSSFCANKACHGSEWEYVDFETFQEPDFLAMMILQLPHYPTTLEPPTDWDQAETLDTIHRVQEELVCEDCHDPMPPKGPPLRAVCIECHGEFEDGAFDLTAYYKPNPHDRHEGTIPCYQCHINFGPEIDPCALCHASSELEVIGEKPED